MHTERSQQGIKDVGELRARTRRVPVNAGEEGAVGKALAGSVRPMHCQGGFPDTGWARQNRDGGAGSAALCQRIQLLQVVIAVDEPGRWQWELPGHRRALNGFGGDVHVTVDGSCLDQCFGGAVRGVGDRVLLGVSHRGRISGSKRFSYSVKAVARCKARSRTAFARTISSGSVTSSGVSMVPSVV